jgi:hypothetical protein
MSSDARTSRVIIPGEAPFSPALILLTTLFASLIGGGLLAGLNWERFYRPTRKWPTIFGAAAVYLLTGLIIVVGYAITQSVALILLGVLLNAVGGVGLVYWQHASYTAWIQKHGVPSPRQIDAKSILLPLMTIVVLQVGILLPLGAYIIVPGVQASLPRHTFSGGGITFDYPRTWTRLEVGGDPVCQMADTECLISLRAPSGLVALDIIRQTGPDIPPDAESAADALWNDLAAGDDLAELDVRNTRLIDEATAVNLLYRQRNPFTTVFDEFIYVRRLFVIHEGALYRFTAVTADPVTLAVDADNLDGLLDGVHFD